MNNLYLQHHGIKGQRWGVRRYQNEDGSYTSAGKKRLEKYAGLSNRDYKNEKKKLLEQNEQNSKFNKEISRLDRKREQIYKDFDLDYYDDDNIDSAPKVTQIANEKYKRISDDIELLSAQRKMDVGRKTADQLTKKYGAEVYNNLELRESVHDGLVGLGLTAAVAIPFALLGRKKNPVTGE